MSASTPASSSFAVPEGFTLHKENTSAILLPASNDAFLNPVQEFNRDLSVASIRTWGDLMNEEKERKWRQTLERRAKKAEAGAHKAKKAKSESRLAGVSCVHESEQGCTIAQENDNAEAPSAEQPPADGSALQPADAQAPPEVSTYGTK